MSELSNALDILTNHVQNVIQQESEPVLFQTGEVISIDPLQIKLQSNFILDETSLLLSATVKETWIDIPTTTGQEGEDGVFMHRHQVIGSTEETNDGGQGASPHKHEINIYTQFALPKIRLWRGLIVGDIVRLLKIQGGQFYFVIEREEKITNEGAING
jgi:hypothetical protein